MRLSRRLLPRLLYLYDPAGEAFSGSAQTTLQEYYSYLNGLLFIIDARTLLAGQCYEQSSMSEDVPSREAGMEVMHVYARVMQMFEISAGLSTKKRYRQSVAVVITRMDALQSGQQSHTVVGHLSAKMDPTHFFYGADSYLLRELLCAAGLQNFVRDLEAHFAHIRYFSCAALEAFHALPSPVASERLL